jgi:peptidoglycan/LPS O-acetylase OafA/YrhL
MKSRNQSLDVLRGVAVLLVIGHHYGYYAFWSRVGGMGVDLFFVLSGYLISGLLFSEFMRTGKINVARFLIRRGFKIYPAYFAMVLILLPFTLRSVRLADFTFMGAYFPAFWGHGWSLSVEEHFYFALPLVLLLSLWARSRDLRWIPVALPIVCAICLVLRYRYALTHSTFYGITQSHLRIDSLFAGVTLGWLKHFRRLEVRRPWIFAVLGFALLIPTFVGLSAIAAATFGYLSLTLAFSCLLVAALNCDWLSHLKPLAKIGLYSYSIYLWHWPIAQLFAGTLRLSCVTFWIYLATSVFFGILMARSIESPALALRDRLLSVPCAAPIAEGDTSAALLSNLPPSDRSSQPCLAR